MPCFVLFFILLRISSIRLCLLEQHRVNKGGLLNVQAFHLSLNVLWKGEFVKHFKLFVSLHFPIVL